MSDQTREERTSALDDFAKSMKMPEASSLPTVYPQYQPPAEAFHGQLPTVHRPRDERLVRERLKFAAAAAGEEFMYRFPVKNRKTGQTDFIEGASIKLANELMRIYGNAEVETRVVDQGDSWLIYARFIDLETGYSRTRPFQQRKSAGKIGGMDDARRQEMALAMGVSKAERNVIVNALQLLADYTFEEAKGSLVARIGSNLDSWRTRIVERLTARIDIARVEAVMGRPAKDWTAPDVARVFAMAKAVYEDGMATEDETFPPIGGQAEPQPQISVPAAPPSPATIEEVQAASVGPVPDEAGATATGEQRPPSSPVATSAHYQECIDKILEYAANKDIPPDERLADLGSIQNTWAHELAGDIGFVQEVVHTARKVTRGEQKESAARKYLLTLVPKDEA